MLTDPAMLDVELRKTGVTLRLLHLEYLEQNRTGGYGYTQFCAHYNAWKSKQQLTMRRDFNAVGWREPQGLRKLTGRFGF